MKKFIGDWIISANISLNKSNFLLKLTYSEPLPLILPGQFVQIKIDNVSSAFLRRTFSINYVNVDKKEIWILIQIVGDGTQALSKSKPGEKLNLIFPLGNAFSMPYSKKSNLLLIGGGVGIAPLLFLGSKLKEEGVTPNFLIGAKNADGLIELDEFHKHGNVFVTTEDGSVGEKGFVTEHSVLQNTFDKIYSCGPTPMMKAVARYAEKYSIDCEVSLENKMACGIGACLCCVTPTQHGHQCVCTEGPVFNTKELVW
ncbi:dihydroorotate dehydrogenase electron transfer subunit [Microbacter margulisiae]|uniref:Dihydroorotate dehydrogenase B (NAD(+)), electron transfer subunit n=1 Tax=Microbacter margulisiae TaxID=1350067 RepID=A0A7W5DP10_9PORP|nr:dihydroorotate dehydrogenase electron transfer subunit [Microbacter margulisiae]MBB3186449.1 dihydroorotate dehydrogenase electron transfer subunit [Microbacter margulisiae]